MPVELPLEPDDPLPVSPEEPDVPLLFSPLLPLAPLLDPDPLSPPLLDVELTPLEPPDAPLLCPEDAPDDEVEPLLLPVPPLEEAPLDDPPEEPLDPVIPLDDPDELDPEPPELPEDELLPLELPVDDPLEPPLDDVEPELLPDDEPENCGLGNLPVSIKFSVALVFDFWLYAYLLTGPSCHTGSEPSPVVNTLP
jgi:hypothetical protein